MRLFNQAWGNTRIARCRRKRKEVFWGSQSSVVKTSYQGDSDSKKGRTQRRKDVYLQERGYPRDERNKGAAKKRERVP